MKLRNRKTGEIWETAVVNSYACGVGYRLLVTKDAYTQVGKHYDSLAELNEEWEDYEEPVKSKYYLRNKETGYVASFETKDEQMCFYNALDDWERVYITTEPCGEKD